ncbi:MAG: hypothetical protein ACFFDP_10450 [Promethearchaeota archaeon]
MMRDYNIYKSDESSSEVIDDHVSAIIREFGRLMREVTTGLDDAMSKWESAHRSSLRPIRIILGCLSKINFLRSVEDLGKLATFDGILDKAITKNMVLLDKLLPKVIDLAADFEGAIRKMRQIEQQVSDLQQRAARILVSESETEPRIIQLVENVDELAKKLREIVSLYESEYLFRIKTIKNIEELMDSKELYMFLILWTMEPYLESDRIEAIRKEIGTHIETTRSLITRQNFSPPKIS